MGPVAYLSRKFLACLNIQPVPIVLEAWVLLFELQINVYKLFVNLTLVRSILPTGNAASEQKPDDDGDIRIDTRLTVPLTTIPE